jgi:E3 ubiquitin-protein ligase BRE1
MPKVRFSNPSFLIPTDIDAVGFCTRFDENAEFSSHLEKKAKQIRSKVTEILNSISSSGPRSPLEAHEYKKEIARLLGKQKEHTAKIDELRVEKESLVEELEAATLRYYTAEKARDRMRSKQVAMIEAKAQRRESNDDEPKVNAILVKQKEQVESLLAENKLITEQLTTANLKLTGLTDDDFARTELFRNFKAQHEEIIKKINHLEATHIQLREEAQKLHAERSSFKTALEAELEAKHDENEIQLQRLETDLIRVRAVRDEAIAENQIRKSREDMHYASVAHMEELVGIKDTAIIGLEAQIQRLKAQIEESSREPTPKLDIDDLGSEELRQKYLELEKSFASVNIELPAMEKAYKRSIALTSKKVMDFTALEQRCSMLLQEKAKADQKYFSARKDTDIQEQNLKSLRIQNAKSVDMVSALKAVEGTNRMLLNNLEKELSELRNTHATIASEKKKVEVANSDLNSKVDGLKVQVTELTNLTKTKDTAHSNSKEKVLSLETTVEKLQVKNQTLTKEKETFKARSRGGQTDEEKELWVSHTTHGRHVHLLTVH